MRRAKKANAHAGAHAGRRHNRFKSCTSCKACGRNSRAPRRSRLCGCGTSKTAANANAQHRQHGQNKPLLRLKFTWHATWSATIFSNPVSGFWMGSCVSRFSLSPPLSLSQRSERAHAHAHTECERRAALQHQTRCALADRMADRIVRLVVAASSTTGLVPDGHSSAPLAPNIPTTACMFHNKHSACCMPSEREILAPYFNRAFKAASAQLALLDPTRTFAFSMIFCDPNGSNPHGGPAEPGKLHVLYSVMARTTALAPAHAPAHTPGAAHD